MALYLFSNPDDPEEVVEVNQPMDSEHVYYDDSGRKWNRVYSSPQVSLDTKVDPFSKKDFLKKTSNKGTIGDLLDRSQEMSEARADKMGGVDPVRKKAEKNFYNPKR